MANANVFAAFAQPVKSVQDYDDEREARKAMQTRNALQALTLQQTNDQFQQATKKRNALEQVMATLRPGATDDERADAFASNPYTMDVADQLRKSSLERRKAEADIGKVGADTAKTQFGTSEDKRKAAIQQVAALNSPDEAIQLLNQQVTAGAIPMQAAQALERMVRSDPKWQVRLVLGINDPKEMLAALQPHMQNAGGALVNTNPLAGPTGQGAPTAIPITQSADNAATQATSRANNAAQVAATMRGQTLVDARSREANSLQREASATVYDPERGVLINKGTGMARPAATMDGKPIGGKDKPLNDTQAKALLFGTRMQEAEKAFSRLVGQGVDQRGMLKRTAEGVADLVPFMGDKLADTAGTLTNWTQSPEQQQVEQAQRDFLNAVLRRESGAAIGASEFANAVKQYFPQPGDSPAVIQQKARNRANATRLMLEEVPEARRSASAPTKPAGGVIDFSDLK